MMNKLIGKLRKNSFQEIQVNIGEFHERQFVDIRIWVGSRGQETFHTAKGVAVPVELFDEFTKIINDANEELKNLG